MFHYFLYGSHVISDMFFFQLIPYEVGCTCTQPEFGITELTAAELTDCGAGSYIRFGKRETVISGEDCILKIYDGNRIGYHCREAETAQAMLPHFILGVGIALLYYQRNLIAVHGSCIYDSQGAVLVCGKSGAGKSTAAAMLLERGYRFMADDITLVAPLQDNVIHAYSAFPYQKLCPDRETELKAGIRLLGEDNKYMIPYQQGLPTMPVRLRAIIILTLSSSGQLHTEEVEGVQKVYACQDIMFLSTILKRELHTVQQGHAIMQLAAQTPLFHIARPQGIDSRADVVNAIIEILSQKQGR